MEKIHVCLKEKAKIIGEKEAEAIAKFDTGATRTCVDMSLAAKAKIGPIEKVVRILAARRKYKRIVAWATIEVNGRKIRAAVGIDDRGHSKEKILIGRDIIKDNFIIDIK